jgi:rubrerythrin
VGLLRDWVLRRVVKSALVFEETSLATYRRLRERLVDDPLWDSLGHLLEEEEHHWRILGDIAAGRLDADEVERIVAEHLYAGLADLAPLDAAARRAWGPELERALEEEERTLLFYGNLGRMSRVPAVRRAFEVLASMEREHVAILRRLLAGTPGVPRDGGNTGGPGGTGGSGDRPGATPVVDSAPPGE